MECPYGPGSGHLGSLGSSHVLHLHGQDEVLGQEDRVSFTAMETLF
jgi:hypothetical protein